MMTVRMRARIMKLALPLFDSSASVTRPADYRSLHDNLPRCNPARGP